MNNIEKLTLIPPIQGPDDLLKTAHREIVLRVLSVMRNPESSPSVQLQAALALWERIDGKPAPATPKPARKSVDPDKMSITELQEEIIRLRNELGTPQ